MTASDRRRLTAILAAILAAAVVCVAAAPGARAGVDAFVDGCIAHLGDLGGIGPYLEAGGMHETDPAAGLTEFATLLPDGRHRVWVRVATPPAKGDAFTGTITQDGDVRVAICWHVSRPGESAAEALPQLRQRYPVSQGAPWRRTHVFYGGEETWDARIDGTDVTIGVAWPVERRLEVGTSELFVIMMRPPRKP